LKSEYILTGKDINFRKHTYHTLRRLGDEWDISNILKEKFGNCYYQNFIQDYFKFICNDIRKFKDSKENIIEISDFPYFEFINNGQNFNFSHLTWNDLKYQSDEWHLENRMAKDPNFKKYLFEK
jgi:hypothetical protein